MGAETVRTREAEKFPLSVPSTSFVLPSGDITSGVATWSGVAGGDEASVRSTPALFDGAVVDDAAAAAEGVAAEAVG
jgi:hypothetical protein